MKRCFACFKEFDDSLSVCPHCGHVEITRAIEPIYLTPGTVLSNRYILGEVIGAGGFGIVYKAWDTKLETIVAVKEFFISRLVTRAEGLKNVIVSKKAQTEFDYRKERFLAEAKNMAKFGTHRSIPNVFEFFEENNTAYIVMELLKGMALNEYLHQVGGMLDPDFAIMIADEVGKALGSLHKENIIHRDVAPDNIFICTGKEIRIKLMDLGAAKLADSTDDVIDIVLKPGYSPPEQYDNTKNIGPWTDIYALGATLYMMLTGIKPDESTNRKISDELVPVNELNPNVSENLSNTVMKAMAIEKHMRFKSVDEFLQALNGERKVLPLDREKKLRKRKRRLSVIAATLVVALVSGIVFQTYSSRRKSEFLEPAEITVWFIEENNNGDMLQNVLKSFVSQEGNTDIKIKYYSIPLEKYDSALLAAFNGSSEYPMPVLFESSTLSEETVSPLSMDLDNIISSSEFKNCDMLKHNYSSHYYSKTKMPLAVDVPVAYIFSNSLSDDYFTEGTIYALDVYLESGCSSAVASNYTIGFTTMSFDQFVNSGSYSGKVMLSSTASMNKFNQMKFRNENFSFKCAYPNYDTIYCDFTYEWSISNYADDAQTRAAEKLLRYMLSDNYLSLLCQDKVPVNSKILNSNDENFAPVADIYDNFIF